MRGLIAFAHVNWNRILSGPLAMLYVIGAYMHAGVESACKAAIGGILPLACIWFADAMGGYIGPTSSGSITNTTPGVFVCIAGWVLLLMPVFVGIGWAIWG
jgi:hypothetical protein